MDQTEKLKGELAVEEKKASAAKDSIARQMADLDQKGKTLEGQLNQLTAERTELAGKVEEGYFALLGQEEEPVFVRGRIRHDHHPVVLRCWRFLHAIIHSLSLVVFEKPSPVIRTPSGRGAAAQPEVDLFELLFGCRSHAGTSSSGDTGVIESSGTPG